VVALMLSITLTGLAASWIAKLLHRFRWIGYLGLAMVVYVSLHMIWEGARNVAIDLGKVEAFNSSMPSMLAITPEDIAEHRGKNKK